MVMQKISILPKMKKGIKKYPFNAVKLRPECERIIWTFAEMPPSRVLCLRDSLEQVKCEGNEQLHPMIQAQATGFYSSSRLIFQII